MLNPTYNRPLNLQPIDTIVNFLIDEPNNRNIIAPNQIQAMCDLARGLWVIWRADDSLYSL